LAAGTAEAATVQVGSPLAGTFTRLPLNNVSTLANKTLSDPGANVTSPVDGTVVNYRLVAPKGTFRLQVIRPTGTGAYAGIASSTPLEFDILIGPSGPIATSLPIQKGDSVAVVNGADTDFLGGAIGSTFSSWVPPLTDGAPARLPSFDGFPGEFGIGATVRYCQVPSLKGKTPKAARAALAAADCTVGKVKKTKKARKKKKVLSQSVAPGTSISDTAPVDLKVSRKRA
jgi:PASTA domain